MTTSNGTQRKELKPKRFYKVITTFTPPIIVFASSRYDAICTARINAGWSFISLKGFTKDVISCKQY